MVGTAGPTPEPSQHDADEMEPIVDEMQLQKPSVWDMPIIWVFVTPATAARNVAVRAEVKEIHMPALSSTMTEGKIVQWTKSEGDKISAGDILMVVESDKADMDGEAFEEG